MTSKNTFLEYNPDDKLSVIAHLTLQLLSHIKPESLDTFTCKKGNNYHLQSDEILFITNGIYMLKNTEDSLCILINDTTIAIGLEKITSTCKNRMYLSALDNIDFYTIKKNKLINIINDNALWAMIAKIYCFQLSFFIDDCYSKIIKKNNYDTIKELIYEYIAMPMKIKSKIKLANYIIERSNISRSNTLKILSALQHLNHLKMERGVLQSVECLPDRI